MMGDPGTSNPGLLYPALGVQEREVLHVQAPGSSHEPSEPAFSDNLDGQHPLFLASLHQHLAESFRPAGSAAGSNRAFEGISIRARNCAENRDQNRLSHAECTSDVMPRARVGEDGLFTFPEGDADAVTITARDLASLEPGKFLTDNTVDFYLKYLEVQATSPEQQHRFHFFNSFFFRKLLETTASMGVDVKRVDYLQLRKWVGDVDLFEKDFVFVPVLASSHWSLLVLCHLRSLNPSALGGKKGLSCILHLDPIHGKQELSEAEVKSFILQAWLERFEAPSNLDKLHSLFQLKYIQAKVPQQGNGYDCGLYILHYVEVFLSKSSLQELIISSFEAGAHFTRPKFGVEVLDKRNCIRRIFSQLSGMSLSNHGDHLSTTSMPQEEDGLVCLGPQQQRVSNVVKEMKSKKWKEMETLVLLQCVVGGRFKKGKLGAIDWNLVADEINSRNEAGPFRSKEQCQNRFDTLLKAYKDLNGYCLKMGKGFCQVTEDEKRSLKLATPLGEEHEDWYNHLRTIYDHRSSLREQSHKRQKRNVDGDMDVNKLASSPIHSSSIRPLPLGGIGHSNSETASSMEVIVEAFMRMEEALRYTFLNLIQVCSLEKYSSQRSLGSVCRMLGMIQYQNPFKICHDVYRLQDLSLLKLSHIGSYRFLEEVCWMNTIWLEFLDLVVYEEFGRKVFSKNPHLTIVLKSSRIEEITTDLCFLQQVRLLDLNNCSDLQIFDLENFPHLCCLYIRSCENLKAVNGWELSKGLEQISIQNCFSYWDLPGFEFLCSLKKITFDGMRNQSVPWQLANFSHCVQLRRLEISKDNALVETMDLKSLSVLEVLSLHCCSSLSTIHGLSELQSLKKLTLIACENLKAVPDLGYLKALIYLNMSFSGIGEIPSLENLHLLKILNLSGCRSLKILPPLGHLKRLVHINVGVTEVEEIVGVEDLISLENLKCFGSKLKQLPNLHHLRRLKYIDVDETPFSRGDPSNSFVGGYKLIFKHVYRRTDFEENWTDIENG